MSQGWGAGEVGLPDQGVSWKGGGGRKPSERAWTHPCGCSGAWEVGNQILNSVTGGMAASLQRQGTQREGADGRSYVWARGTRGAGRRVTGIPSRQLRPGSPWVRVCAHREKGGQEEGSYTEQSSRSPRAQRSSLQRAGLLCIRQEMERTSIEVTSPLEAVGPLNG